MMSRLIVFFFLYICQITESMVCLCVSLGSRNHGETLLGGEMYWERAVSRSFFFPKTLVFEQGWVLKEGMPPPASQFVHAATGRETTGKKPSLSPETLNCVIQVKLLLGNEFIVR